MRDGRTNYWRNRALVGVVVAAAIAVALLVLPGRSWFGTGGGSESPQLGQQVAVTAANGRASRANNSPLLVADPGDGKFLALSNRLDSPAYGCSLHVSGDGGRRWTPVDPVPVLPDGTDLCYGPEVAIDGKGRIHYAFLGLSGPGHLPFGMYITTSTDRGRTFSAPRQVQGTFNFGMRMAVDPGHGDEGRIHLVWLHAGESPGLGSLGTSDNPILAAHSDDGGQTFSEPVRVSDPARPRSVAPALALGPGGAVHVAYYDLLDDTRDYQGLEGPTWEGTWELVLASSSDDGATFGTGVVVEPEVVPHERVMVIFTMAPPSLVAGDDRVCLAWTDAREGDADVLSKCSSDEGEWGPATRLNDDPVANGRTQYMPRLSLAPGGRLDAVYLDRRDDPQNLSNDVAYTYSRNGGRTFASSVRLTTTGKSSSLVGQRYPIPSAGLERYDFGFRIALLSRSDDALAAWTDTHNSPADSKVQDIFAISVSPPASGGGGALVLFVALVVAIAGVAALLVWRLRRRPEPLASGPMSAGDGAEEAVGDSTRVGSHADEAATSHG